MAQTRKFKSGYKVGLAALGSIALLTVCTSIYAYFTDSTEKYNALSLSASDQNIKIAVGKNRTNLKQCKFNFTIDNINKKAYVTITNESGNLAGSAVVSLDSSDVTGIFVRETRYTTFGFSDLSVYEYYTPEIVSNPLNAAVRSPAFMLNRVENLMQADEPEVTDSIQETPEAETSHNGTEKALVPTAESESEKQDEEENSPAETDDSTADTESEGGSETAESESEDEMTESLPGDSPDSSSADDSSESDEETDESTEDETSSAEE